MVRKWRACYQLMMVWMLAMLLSVASAHAADRWFVDAGLLDVHNGLGMQIGAEFDWGWSYAGAAGAVKGAWQISASSGYWRNPPHKGVMFGIGLMPLLRWEMKAPFVLEAGAGVHLVAGRPSNQLSTALEFGEIAGLYYRYSPDAWFGYRFMHLSNGGMKQPNGGVNYHLFHLVFSY